MRGWLYFSFYSFCFMFNLMLAKRASDSISKRFVLITAKPKTRIHGNESSVLSKTFEKVLKSIFAFLLGNVFTLISFSFAAALLSLPLIILTRGIIIKPVYLIVIPRFICVSLSIFESVSLFGTDFFLYDSHFRQSVLARINSKTNFPTGNRRGDGGAFSVRHVLFAVPSRTVDDDRARIFF